MSDRPVPETGKKAGDMDSAPSGAPSGLVNAGFTDSRAGVLDAIYRMGVTCCAYSGSGHWADRCDCKYGVAEVRKWPTVNEVGNGCPELRSLYVVIQALTDDEWALLVHRANGTPRGAVFWDDIGSRLHAAEAAAAMAEANIARVRQALATPAEVE